MRRAKRRRTPKNVRNKIMTRLKRLIPALLCASLSIGSLRAAEWTADQLRLSAPYMQLGYFDQARRNASVEGRPISIGAAPRKVA